MKSVYGLNLCQQGWPQSLERLATFGYLRFLNPAKTLGIGVYSKLPIEVYITATFKDYVTLPAVIEGVRRNLKHPISAISIVTPKDERLAELCSSLNCRHIAEESVLAFPKSKINYHFKGVDRSGWLYQQLIKLGVDSLCQEEHYFVIDADTVLIKPQKFEVDGKLLLLNSDEFHYPYFLTNRKLVDLREVSFNSCVSHQMIFSKSRVAGLKNRIESLHGVPWYDAIIEKCDYSSASGFSEFELYGQWSLNMYFSDTICEYWQNLALPRSKLLKNELMEEEYAMTYRSISFHSYLNESN